jgi:hypothetical protein
MIYRLHGGYHILKEALRFVDLCMNKYLKCAKQIFFIKSENKCYLEVH